MGRTHQRRLIVKNGKRIFETAVHGVFLILGLITVACVLLITVYLVISGIPAIREIGLIPFLFGDKWASTAAEPSYGILPFILTSIYGTAGAILLGVPIGFFAAVYLAKVASPRVKAVMQSAVSLLAGIPSVVYGFVGLLVLVKFFLKAGVHTGSCVLAAGILLAVMLLPYLVSSCSETILKAKERYLPAADALGISPWYTVAAVILPASWKNILLSIVLAIGRAMGETMAVMMVMGNANLFPTLLGKGESIAAVIALEMGTAVVGSTHYHALYAAGLVLMVLLFVINVGITLLRDRLLRREGGGK